MAAMVAGNEPKFAGVASDGFRTTRWSVIARAKTPGDGGRIAVEELCRAYWRPLYAFARRRGHGVPEAEDLVQGFFAEFLEGEQVRDVDPDRGRFRAWLSAAFRHYLGHERERVRAKKRGGDRVKTSLDLRDAEDRLAFEPARGETPERAFDRAFAEAVIERAREALARSYREGGEEALYARLAPSLGVRGLEGGFAAAAADLGTNEGALRVAAHRLRQRFGAMLRAEVEALLLPGETIEDEIAFLHAALGREDARSAPRP